MSKMNCPTKNPLQRDGTSQFQRMLEALDPSYARIHDFSTADWMHFAWYYAYKVAYFNVGNNLNAQGDWRSFMVAEEEISHFLASVNQEENGADVEPHLALFLSFLLLMKEPQQQMNSLTKQHLDFYYKNILQLRKQAPAMDQVHIVFELAKHVKEHRLEDDCLLDAGKDSKSIPRNYIIKDNPVIYPAKVSALKSIIHKDNQFVRSAEVANSLDGNGTALLPENPTWYPFGFENVPLEKDSAAMISLPDAKLGFAIASGVLLMKEGQRTITVSIDFNFPNSGVNYSRFNSLEDQLKIFITGEKGWITPSTLDIVQSPTAGQQKLIFELVIDSAEKAIVSYDAALHKERFNTDRPVLRVLLETGIGAGYKTYKELSKASIKKIKINVAVSGMKEITIENDGGKLDPAKAFLPFGPMPKKGSNFYIGSPEIFQKKWEKLSLNIDWKDKPGNLSDHYTAYRDRYMGEKFTRNKYDLVVNSSNNLSTASGAQEIVENDNYFKVDLAYIKNNRWSTAQERNLFITGAMEITPGGGNSFLNLSYGWLQLFITGFNSNKSYLQNYIQSSPVNNTFNYPLFNPGFVITDFNQQAFGANTKDNFLRLQLQQDFFHAVYPVLYSAAMGIPGAVIPKEPYTPTIASITLNYEAGEENEFNIGIQSNSSKLENYQSRNIQYFHEAPFGQAEQHVFLKEQAKFLQDKQNIPAVPVYLSEGNLFIGISGAIPQTSIRLLCQVAEGSENPEAPMFEESAPLEWSVLCNNEWKLLNRDFIIANDTNNFLKPGIIQLQLPIETTTNNTLFPGNLTWLRAQLPPGMPYDAVCKFLDIIAQTVQAGFINQGNDLTHLSTALPAGTISKLINRVSAVKELKQPFNSFGGRPEENDTQFYTRVSERLRHKNRAIMIWDYERLVLQNFPNIYKVKCLNHTSSNFELAPGFVRVIPIPDTRNKNIYNIYEPRVSKNMLTEIENFLQGKIGFHIDCKAENPQFENIQFDFKVKFYPQYDPNTYLKILQEALKHYLAPWAFGEHNSIQFGGTLYKSKVISYIEDLKYVDFITDFKMYNMKIGSIDQDMIIAENSRAILTTYKTHQVTPIQPPVCP